MAAGRRLLASLTLVALVAAGCSAGGGNTAPDTTKRSASARKLIVEPVTTLDVGPIEVYSIDVVGDRAAWAASDPSGGLPNKVMLLEDGQARELVRTQYPKGYLPHVRLSRKWAVFVDLTTSEPAHEGEPQKPWRMEAINLDTDERVVIAEQSPTAREDSPTPSIEGDVVVWSTLRGEGLDKDIVAYDLSTRAKRTLTRATIYNITVGGGKVYYDGYTETGSDIFAVPLDGSNAPEQVSRTGQAIMPAASRYGVAWVEPPGQDSTKITVVRPGRAPEDLATGTIGDPAGYNPRVCDGFGMWDPLQGLYARPFGSNTESTMLAAAATLSISPRWSCDGKTVAWVSFKTDAGTSSGVTIHIARVKVRS